MIKVFDKNKVSQITYNSSPKFYSSVKHFSAGNSNFGYLLIKI